MTDKAHKVPIWNISPWSWFFSLKIGIVLLAVVTAASVYGTLIDPLEKAQQVVYYAWWYQALLVLLAVSISCTTYRTLMLKVLPLRHPRFMRQPQVYGAMKPGASVAFRGGAAQAGEAFRAKGFRVFIEGPFGYARRGMAAWWGAPLSHLGAVMILLSGFAAGWVNREGVVQLVEGGSTTNMRMRTVEQEIAPLGFTLMCDDFHTEFFPKTRIPATFTSTIAHIEDGQRVETDIVEVNKSMNVHGWILHQTSYQEVPELARYLMTISGPGMSEPATMEVSLGQKRPIPGVDGVEIELITGPGARWAIHQNGQVVAEGGQAARSYEFNLLATAQDQAGDPQRLTMKTGEEREVKIGDAAWTVKALQFEPDFVLGPDRLATSRSENLNNPALRVMFKGADGVEHTQWLFGRADMKAMSHSGSGLLNLELSQVSPVAADEGDSGEAHTAGWSVVQGERVTAYATVLTLTRNPVFPIVYAGCAIMMLGLMVAFFIRRREVWFFADDANGRLHVIAQYRHAATELDAKTKAVLAGLAGSAGANELKSETVESQAS